MKTRTLYDQRHNGSAGPARSRPTFSRALGLLLGALFLAQTNLVQATDFTIQTNDPDVSADGNCSLREAIDNANDDAQTHADCPAGSGADTVDLGSNVSLTDIDNSVNGLPLITSDITIEGNGYTLERAYTTCDDTDSDPDFRLFEVTGALTLKNITLQNACNPSDLGGAVYLQSSASLTIQDSTLQNNTAQRGGAIFAYGGFFISNSTINDNVGSLSGGALIIQSGSISTIVNSTLSGNTSSGSGGAVVINSTGSPAGLTLYSSTVTLNHGNIGGGIYLGSGETMSLYNSIISGNTADTSDPECTGDFSSQAAYNNILGNSDDNGGCTGFGTDVNNLTPSGALSTILDTTLADNGGTTLTYALATGSPAINAGDNSQLPNESTLGIDVDGDSITDDPIDGDQTGGTRINYSTVDAGAYEVAGCAAYVFPYTVGTLQSDLVQDLRDAITCANSNATADTINLNGAISVDDYVSVSSSRRAFPGIVTDITINGNGYTIERNATYTVCDNSATSFGLFYVRNGGTLYLNEMTLRNGCANDGVSSYGGAVYVNNATDTLYANKVLFDGNTAGRNGGAILTGGQAVVTNSLFTRNSTQQYGGGAIEFYTDGGNSSSLTVVNSTFVDNTATTDGGALAITTIGTSPVAITNSTIVDNTGSIGGVYVDSASNVQLANNIVSGNASGDCGGTSLSSVVARNNVLGSSGSANGCTGFASASGNVTPAGDITTIVETSGGVPVLADNGGSTQTVALVDGSPAIDAGDDSQLPNESTLGIDVDGDSLTDDPIDVDQRGELRVTNGAVDAGAYETGDTYGPTILSMSPADGSSNVSTRPNMTILFHETVIRDISMAVQMRRLSDDAVIQSFKNTNAIGLSTTNVTHDTVTINWNKELDKLTEYYIYIEAGAFTDALSNPFAGILDNSTWNITTGDYLEPQIVSLTPADNSSDASISTNLTVQFDEAVTTGTGNITLYSGTEVTALFEPFDDASLFIGENQFSSSGGGQYFGINFGLGDGSGIWGNYNGSPSANPTTATYTGFDGAYLDTADSGQMVATSDAGLSGDTPAELLWDDIDITGLTHLSFRGDFTSTNAVEPADYVIIEVDIDNTGSFTEILDLRGDGDSVARQELTGDGVGDGAALSSQARTFIIPISGTGSTLDLRMKTLTSSGGDRYAMDNFTITGISGATQVEQVPVTDASVTIVGDTLTYDPTATLIDMTSYFIVIDEGALTDTSVNANVLDDLAAAAAWNFTLVNQAPTAADVTIAGTLSESLSLTGTYTYSDAEGDAENGSTYRWQRADDGSGGNAADISGADTTGYTVTAADVGKYLSFCVTPNNSNGVGAEACSAWSRVNSPPAVSNVAISGTLADGQTLTGSYSYSDPDGDPETGSSLRWLRADDAAGSNPADIVGDFGTTYTLTGADVGKYLSFCVTPSDGNYDGSEACSAWSGPVTTYYTVTPNADAGGSLDPATAQSVQQGQATSFWVIPDTGYSIDAVSGCGGSLSGDLYTTAAITADCTVSATFSLKTYAIAAQASPTAGGSVSCTPNPVNHGASTTCTASTNIGYNFSGWSGDCTGSGSCLLASVNGSRAVTANFIEDPSIAYQCTPGSVTVTSPSHVMDEVIEAETTLQTQGTVIVSNGQNVRYAAAQSITLQDGFQAEGGSLFQASIRGDLRCQ